LGASPAIISNVEKSVKKTIQKFLWLMNLFWIVININCF
jgi:hypothetical protein